MGQLNAWIRATKKDGYGSIHFTRAIALAEAAVREGIDTITLVVDGDEVKGIKEALPKGVKLEVFSTKLTPPQEAAQICEMVKSYVPKRVDGSNPRPLVYLCGSSFSEEYQRMIWKGGAELVVIADEPGTTHADWMVLPKPYASELEVPSQTGYTRFLRGAHYAPFRIKTIKNIPRQRNHDGIASRFAFATENVDVKTWLPKLIASLNGLENPSDGEKPWKPELTLIATPDCPADAELMAMAGDTGKVQVKVLPERENASEALIEQHVLFAADSVALEEALALGVVRVVLPRAGVAKQEDDLMFDHCIRRELSPEIPMPDDSEFEGKMKEVLHRLCFDAPYRRAQLRIGQYVCDGIGSIRIIRQTAFKVYTVPQNVVRFFETGDPLIAKL